MVTINDALLRGTPTFWAGSKLTRDSEANTNVSTDATQISIPVGATSVVISSRGGQDFWVWVQAPSAGTPSKTTPTAGLQHVNGGGQARWEARLDPDDLPEIWVAENGGSDDTFDLLFQ